MYPITAMGSHTAGGVVDVQGFCRDNNMVMTGFMIGGAADPDGNILANIDLTPGGQDERHHYVLPAFALWPYNITIKTIYTATTTATQVFILGMNP